MEAAGLVLFALSVSRHLSFVGRATRLENSIESESESSLVPKVTARLFAEFGRLCSSSTDSRIREETSFLDLAR